MSTSILYHAFGLKGIQYESARFFGDCVLISARTTDTKLRSRLYRLVIGIVGWAEANALPTYSDGHKVPILLNKIPDFGIHDPAVVSADIARSGFIQGGFVHEHGGVRQT